MTRVRSLSLYRRRCGATGRLRCASADKHAVSNRFLTCSCIPAVLFCPCSAAAIGFDGCNIIQEANTIGSYFHMGGYGNEIHEQTEVRLCCEFCCYIESMPHDRCWSPVNCMAVNHPSHTRPFYLMPPCRWPPYAGANGSLTTSQRGRCSTCR